MQTEVSATPVNVWLFIAIAAGVVALVVLLWIWTKGRRRPGAHVFRASRLSKGNRLFPAQVILTETSITHYKPQWIGKLEESIHLAHVASIRIDTNLIFSDVFIESSGGANPIACYGHTRGDAVRIKRLVEEFQTAHYKR
jgi:hypothetical protein